MMLSGMRILPLILLAVVAGVSSPAFARAPAKHFTVREILSYPYPVNLTASKSGNEIAWVLNERGVRNIWVAHAPDFKPHQITHYHGDTGWVLSHLTFSPDGGYLVYVRGDTSGNWSVPGHRQPDPTSGLKKRYLQLWTVALKNGHPKRLGHGNSPAISADSKTVAFIHVQDHSVRSAPIDGSKKATRLFFDWGQDSDLSWSPQGRQLAFVSDRGDHSFIGIFKSGHQSIRFLNPQVSHDFAPQWSPDGKKVAFLRRPGLGGAPQNPRAVHSRPWSIWVADAAAGKAHPVWKSPHTLNGSFPETAGRANLHWVAGNHLLFLSDVDGWPHLYVVPAAGGKPKRLTTGDYMVEYIDVSPDRRFIVYNANTGGKPNDIDRRHLFKVSVNGGDPQALTAGTTLEWAPAVVSNGKTVAFIQAGVKQPPLIKVQSIAGGHARALDADRVPADFPASKLVVPKDVTFKSSDGLSIHGQLFEHAGGPAKKPAMIYVHGGPPRQMLLGWHYFRYYANDYAVNQWLANHGYVVLSVNYRLGIGYGRSFHHPRHAGPMGAAEYKDVLAGAQYLRHLDDVDKKRLGIWGGSYGGYLTALALARNSDIFAAGVDMHGIHDYSDDLHFSDRTAPPPHRYQHLNWKKLYQTAWHSSAEFSMDKWKSPVLLIHGDDDRNVHFHQTVDLVQRLKAHQIPYELLVIPNEVHDFLRYHSWLEADRHAVRFLNDQFGMKSRRRETDAAAQNASLGRTKR